MFQIVKANYKNNRQHKEIRRSAMKADTQIIRTPDRDKSKNRRMKSSEN